MGQIIGSIFGVFVLYSIWEWVLFRRIMDDPLKGKMLSLLAAYLTAAIIWGFGAADGGPFRTDGFFLYLVGAVPVGVYAYHRGNKLRREPNAANDAETFR